VDSASLPKGLLEAEEHESNGGTFLCKSDLWLSSTDKTFAQPLSYSVGHGHISLAYGVGPTSNRAPILAMHTVDQTHVHD
jgi:hypothetical protein